MNKDTITEERKARMKSLKRPAGILCFIWCLLSASVALAGAPPKIRADYRAIIRANAMDRVQMSCPVHQQSGDSAGLFISWLKDNESLPVMMIRFETKGAHLMIEDVEPEDAGVYVCIATNGFGSQRAAIQLIVTDPQTESTTVADIENSSDDLLIEKLSFTEETLRQPNRVRITAGSSLDIQCVVAGYPYPDLIWLKDGVVYKRWQQQNAADETSWRTASRLTLAIRRAGPSSSANYTCLALGLKGKMQTTFIVSVLDSAVSDMSEVHPANVTEFRGGRAKFHCWVRSTSLPQVEWLKRLPGHPLRPDLSLYPNTSLVVGEDHYQKLEGDELVRKEDGSYLKTLQLDPLSENDAGLYLCLGNNRYGYTIEKTYLNVKPNYETSKESKSVPISIMVALPSILLLSIGCGFVCWMRRREKRRRLAELAALATGWSHGLASPQQQQEQQQAMQTTTETTLGRGGSGHSSCHSRQTLTSGAGCHHLNEEADTGLAVGSPAAKRTGVEIDCRSGGQQLKADDLQSNYYFQPQRHHQLEQQRNTSSSLII